MKFRKKTQRMIDTYYKDNQNTLIKAGYNKDLFERNIKSLMNTNNIRAKTAIRVFAHKTDFVDKERIGAENAVAAMKSFKYTNSRESLYSDFRREVVGWKNKIDMSKFKYDEERNGYIYEGELQTVLLTLKTGPYGSQYWSWETI